MLSSQSLLSGIPKSVLDAIIGAGGPNAGFGGQLPGVQVGGQTTTIPGVVPPPPPGSASVPSTPAGGGGGALGPLESDPLYEQALADEKASLAAAAARRDSSTNQSMIQFGAVPDFSSIGHALGLSAQQIAAITGELNPETAALAKQYSASGDSVMAQLNKAHDTALNQLRANLAARGSLESGATGVGVQQGNDAYQHGLSQAMQQLLGNLLGFQDQYTSDANSARAQLENAASSAYDRLSQMAQHDPSSVGSGGGGSGGSSPSASPYGTIPAAVVNHIVPAAIAAGEPVSEHGLGGGYTPRPIADRIAKTPVNPYTTGQKAFG